MCLDALLATDYSLPAYRMTPDAACRSHRLFLSPMIPVPVSAALALLLSLSFPFPSSTLLSSDLMCDYWSTIPADSYHVGRDDLFTSLWLLLHRHSAERYHTSLPTPCSSTDPYWFASSRAGSARTNVKLFLIPLNPLAQHLPRSYKGGLMCCPHSLFD